MVQAGFGSGGGGGNSYSPGQKNAGGEGGGLVIIDGGKEIVFGNGYIYNRGLQGFPRKGTGAYNSWTRSNPQDGSGGGGAGGGVLLIAKSKVNMGNNRIKVDGGICGADQAWRNRAQIGGPGGNGRVTARTPKVDGTCCGSALKRFNP